jgi:hypothetical protein
LLARPEFALPSSLTPTLAHAHDLKCGRFEQEQE